MHVLRPTVGHCNACSPLAAGNALCSPKQHRAASRVIYRPDHKHMAAANSAVEEQLYTEEELRGGYGKLAPPHGPMAQPLVGSVLPSSTIGNNRNDVPGTGVSPLTAPDAGGSPAWLQRSQLLLGDDGLATLAQTRVLIVGLGECRHIVAISLALSCVSIRTLFSC